MEIHEIKSVKSKIKYAKISVVHGLEEMCEGAEEIYDLGFLDKDTINKVNVIKKAIIAKLAELEKLISK